MYLRCPKFAHVCVLEGMLLLLVTFNTMLGIFSPGLVPAQATGGPPRWEQCERLKCSAHTDCKRRTPGGCCADELLSMMKDIHSILASVDSHHFLMYGSLLGATRDNDIIPWDTDVDFVISEEAYAQWPAWKSALTNAGYAIFKDTILRICRASNTTRTQNYDQPWNNHAWFPYVDVYKMAVNGDVASISEDPSTYQTKWLLPPSACTIRAHTFPCAAKPYLVLGMVYGKTWEIPNNRYHSYRHPSKNFFFQSEPHTKLLLFFSLIFILPRLFRFCLFFY